MIVEVISQNNLAAITTLALALWPDCTYEAELEHYKTIITASNEVCFTVKLQDQYIAFIHISAHHDYVEGAITLPVAYIEGIYVHANYRKHGIARVLLNEAYAWAKQKGFKQIASDTEIENQTSIAFHKNNGFEVMERKVCFIKSLH